MTHVRSPAEIERRTRKKRQRELAKKGVVRSICPIFLGAFEAGGQADTAGAAAPASMPRMSDFNKDGHLERVPDCVPEATYAKAVLEADDFDDAIRRTHGMAASEIAARREALVELLPSLVYLSPKSAHGRVDATSVAFRNVKRHLHARTRAAAQNVPQTL